MSPFLFCVIATSRGGFREIWRFRTPGKRTSKTYSRIAKHFKQITLVIIEHLCYYNHAAFIAFLAVFSCTFTTEHRVGTRYIVPVWSHRAQKGSGYSFRGTNRKRILPSPHGIFIMEKPSMKKGVSEENHSFLFFLFFETNGGVWPWRLSRSISSRCCSGTPLGGQPPSTTSTTSRSIPVG